MIIVAYAIPPVFCRQCLLAGVWVRRAGHNGRYCRLRGLDIRQLFDELSLPGKIADYFWHIALPVHGIDRLPSLGGH